MEKLELFNFFPEFKLCFDCQQLIAISICFVHVLHADFVNTFSVPFPTPLNNWHVEKIFRNCLFEEMSYYYSAQGAHMSKPGSAKKTRTRFLVSFIRFFTIGLQILFQSFPTIIYPTNSSVLLPVIWTHKMQSLLPKLPTVHPLYQEYYFSLLRI